MPLVVVVAESIFIMSAAVGATSAERMDSGALALMEKLSHLSPPTPHTLTHFISHSLMLFLLPCQTGVISKCVILFLPAPVVSSNLAKAEAVIIEITFFHVCSERNTLMGAILGMWDTIEAVWKLPYKYKHVTNC